MVQSGLGFAGVEGVQRLLLKAFVVYEPSLQQDAAGLRFTSVHGPSFGVHAEHTLGGCWGRGGGLVVCAGRAPE